MAVAGDPCPRCDGVLDLARGIEVGHVFKLGTKYSESLSAEYLDESENKHPNEYNRSSRIWNSKWIDLRMVYTSWNNISILSGGWQIKY